MVAWNPAEILSLIIVIVLPVYAAFIARQAFAARKRFGEELLQKSVFWLIFSLIAFTLLVEVFLATYLVEEFEWLPYLLAFVMFFGCLKTLVAIAAVNELFSYREPPKAFKPARLAIALVVFATAWILVSRFIAATMEISSPKQVVLFAFFVLFSLLGFALLNWTQKTRARVTEPLLVGSFNWCANSLTLFALLVQAQALFELTGSPVLSAARVLLLLATAFCLYKARDYLNRFAQVFSIAVEAKIRRDRGLPATA